MTKYGLKELWICCLVAGAAIAGLGVVAVRVCPYALTLLVFPVAFLAWVLWFFRDPHRDTPQGEGLFISPADGRVTDVTPVGADSELGCPGIKIGIFMSIFSIHVNRSPHAGKVLSVQHRKGAFLDARDPQASHRNESATVHLAASPSGLTIVFRQIAGLIARRIVTDLRPGQELRAGERIGMIKFGSRMELLVPAQLAGEVRVQVGQHVRAGLTVLIGPCSQPAAAGARPTPSLGSPNAPQKDGEI